MLFPVGVNLLTHCEKVASNPVQSNRSRNFVGDKSNKEWKDIFHLHTHTLGEAVLEGGRVPTRFWWFRHVVRLQILGNSCQYRQN